MEFKKIKKTELTEPWFKAGSKLLLIACVSIMQCRVPEICSLVAFVWL